MCVCVIRCLRLFWAVLCFFVFTGTGAGPVSRARLPQKDLVKTVVDQIGTYRFRTGWTGPGVALNRTKPRRSGLALSRLGLTAAKRRLSSVFRQDWTRWVWTGFSSDHFPPVFHPICYVPKPSRSGSHSQVFHVVLFPKKSLFISFPQYLFVWAVWAEEAWKQSIFLTGLVWLTIAVPKEKVKLNI